MNGWNVQQAVGAYFDLEASAEARAAPPKMTFVSLIRVNDQYCDRLISSVKIFCAMNVFRSVM